MASPQALTEAERRTVAFWAATCAERWLAVFEAEAPDDLRPRDAIARARAFGRGELDAATEIRRRFVAGRAAHAVQRPAAIAAARSAAQAAGVAHMGAHALGAAAYAAKTAALSTPDRPSAAEDEVSWQLSRLSEEQRAALRRLPLLGEDTAGPLRPGLLAAGVLGIAITRIQADLRT
ncbi:MAG: hypothetical protein HIU86_01365 [Acidobacteria bacterium]|nr:hypothetical protein [Acidobacteriota bacterium]